MNREEAKKKFEIADRLFAERRFLQALKLLTEIDAVFPNQRHILFPMARCLAGLKRDAEALGLAERVARDFEYAPAAELSKRLQDKQARGSIATPTSGVTPATQGFSARDFSAGTPLPPNVEIPLNQPQPVVASEASVVERPSEAWRSIALWILQVAIGYGVYVGVAATVGRPAMEYYADQEEHGEDYKYGNLKAPETPLQSIVYLLTSYVFHFYFLACFPAYWSVRIVDALRYNDFGEDMKDAATYTLFGFLLTPMVVVGWLAFLYFLRRRFDLSAGKLVGVVVMFCVFSGLLWFVDQILIALVIVPALGVG